MPRRKGRRRTRVVVVRRLVAVGVLVLVSLLYYRPLRTYIDVHAQLDRRHAEVRRLRIEKASLERRLHSASTPAELAREARALGYVRPGEHLYIVRGIEAWRKRERAGNASGRGH